MITAGAARHDASTAAAAIADEIRDALAVRRPVRIVGGGTWLDAGRPVVAARRLETAGASGIVDYVPGDLTLTALAGTTLHDIETATAANDQWLPLDPFGSLDGTLGATVATASSGPLAHANGGPRDLVLGMECVTGSGEVVRGGGRVAKNVAGFDLTRLLVGSWGTLGVLTEISVRLRGRPAVQTTVALHMPSERTEFASRLERVRRAPLEAMAMELVNAPLAGRLGLEPRAVILVRLGGNEDSVRAQRATLARIGEIIDVPGRCWAELRGIEPPGAAVWRISSLPSRLSDTWTHAEATVHDPRNAWVHASVGRGIVRCIDTRMPDDMSRSSNGVDDWGDHMVNSPFTGTSFAGTIIAERLPSRTWTTLTRSPADDVISRRIRSSFDPHHILNPGIFGEVTL